MNGPDRPFPLKTWHQPRQWPRGLVILVLGLGFGFWLGYLACQWLPVGPAAAQWRHHQQRLMQDHPR